MTLVHFHMFILLEKIERKYLNCRLPATSRTRICSTRPCRTWYGGGWGEGAPRRAGARPRGTAAGPPAPPPPTPAARCLLPPPSPTPGPGRLHRGLGPLRGWAIALLTIWLVLYQPLPNDLFTITNNKSYMCYLQSTDILTHALLLSHMSADYSAVQ